MRKDLENYLTSLQKQYNDMQKAVEEANQMLKDGKMNSDTAMMIQKYMDNINVNYQRVLYCRYLVNLPPKFIQKLQEKKLKKEMEKFKEEHSDDESVIAETQENLDNLKEQLPEKKDE